MTFSKWLLMSTAGAVTFAAPAMAQTPDRSLRLIIAFPPGGSTDILGRLIAPRMGEVLGALVTPENRSGASGAVGAGFVAQAAPDGGTILLDSGGQSVNPFLMRGLGFDYVRDLAPITLLTTLPLILITGAEYGVAVLTDVHNPQDCALAAQAVDVLQIPAFLCRQTDFIRAVAQSGKPVNIKKGQFLAPHDMKNVIDKARAAAREAGLPEDNFMACERGASFGYNNLVSDMRSLAIMRETGAPVVYDATHSVQLPGGQGTSSGGMREMVPVLSRAAVAVGVAGLFMETHPNPAQAMSDGPNAVPLQHMKALLETLLELDAVTKKNPFLENNFQ